MITRKHGQIHQTLSPLTELAFSTRFNSYNFCNLSSSDFTEIHNLSVQQKYNSLDQSNLIAKLYNLRNALFLISLLDYEPSDKASKSEVLKLILEIGKMFKLDLSKDDITYMHTTLANNTNRLRLLGIRNQNSRFFNLISQVMCTNKYEVRSLMSNYMLNLLYYSNNKMTFILKFNFIKILNY